jgi:chemotaxis signal transduction protein
MGAMGALAIAGPIGLAVGALLGPTLGKALGGLFGTKTTIKGQGLFGGAQSLGDILSGGFDLQEYVDVQVKKKTFGVTTSTKNKTQFAEANKELEKQFTLIFGGFYDSILSATDILGANTDEVKTKLENAIINIGKIDLKGLKGDEIQENQFLTFGIEKETYAIDLLNVMEIIRLIQITPIPETFNFIKGIINLRGKIIPVMDIRMRFALEEKPYEDRTCIIVVSVEGASMGLIVDHVSEVLEIPENRMENVSGVSASEAQRFVKMVGKMDSGVKIILDTKELIVHLDDDINKQAA